MINLKKKFKDIDEYYSPKVIGEVNDVYIKLAMIKGDKLPWHQHEHEDEMFYIVDGRLLMEVDGLEPFMMHEGDMYIVPRGSRHRVSSTRTCKIMLIENKTTAHTGNVRSDLTKTIEEQLL